MIDYKISFVTVSMNRLHHLRLTLPANLLDNQHYKNLEFIVLDYNSSDNIEEYIKEFMMPYIHSGRLVYYKTFSPKFFNRSHSRNLAYKLATGDILCNIDADNYTGKNFSGYINRCFMKDKKIFLTTIGTDSLTSTKDVLGRICVKREDFYKIRGYDESMIGYGFEDYDFANRLELAGLTRSFIDEKGGYLNAINHATAERISNEFISRSIKSVYIHYISHLKSEIVFLLDTGRFKKAILVYKPNTEHFSPADQFYKLSFHENDWIEGHWYKKSDTIQLIGDQSYQGNFFAINKKRYISSKNKFYRITNSYVIQKAILVFTAISNRIITDSNKSSIELIINEVNFGNDIVYKNFNYSTSIVI